jgi:putative membrane protein
MARRRQRKSIWKGAVAGMAGGLAASWVMNEFQAGWSAVAKSLSQNESTNGGGDRQQPDEAEDATMKAAGKLSESLLRRPLTKEEKKKAGPLVHYAFGTAMGALYGVLSEEIPKVKSGFGLPFGAALFIGADEIAVPALGLSSQSPSETKPQDHIYGLVSHFVYGATTELVRGEVRKYL